LGVGDDLGAETRSKAMSHRRLPLKNGKPSLAEAKIIASLLPAIMRQLFTIDHRLAAELSLAQLRVCGMLYGGPRPMSALGRELGVSSSAMTQIADRLERARMVKRASQGGDRRIRCLQLTPHGKKVMQLHEDARTKRVSAVLRHMPRKSRGEVLATLRRLTLACVTAKEQNGNSK
jgi:DNA-binding MarR family transcriptional regulator